MTIFMFVQRSTSKTTFIPYKKVDTRYLFGFFYFLINGTIHENGGVLCNYVRGVRLDVPRGFN